MFAVRGELFDQLEHALSAGYPGEHAEHRFFSSGRRRDGSGAAVLAGREKDPRLLDRNAHPLAIGPRGVLADGDDPSETPKQQARRSAGGRVLLEQQMDDGRAPSRRQAQNGRAEVSVGGGPDADSDDVGPRPCELCAQPPDRTHHRRCTQGFGDRRELDRRRRDPQRAAAAEQLAIARAEDPQRDRAALGGEGLTEPEREDLSAAEELDVVEQPDLGRPGVFSTMAPVVMQPRSKPNQPDARA